MLKKQLKSHQNFSQLRQSWLTGRRNGASYCTEGMGIDKKFDLDQDRQWFHSLFVSQQIDPDLNSFLSQLSITRTLSDKKVSN